MSDETNDGVAAPEPSSDDFVVANWDVTVLPGENISIHYRVSPKSDEDSVTSVSASVVEMKDGMVMHSFLGSSASDSLAPKPGQGMVGDTGADVSVFHGHEITGELAAILAGTVRSGESIQNFYFSRPVTLEAPAGADDAADDTAEDAGDDEE